MSLCSPRLVPAGSGADLYTEKRHPGVAFRELEQDRCCEAEDPQALFSITHQAQGDTLSQPIDYKTVRSSRATNYIAEKS